MILGTVCGLFGRVIRFVTGLAGAALAAGGALVGVLLIPLCGILVLLLAGLVLVPLLLVAAIAVGAWLLYRIARPRRARV
ncbi:MAG: hypothetical protein AB7U87_05505 [Candidatus Bipolaricaulis sp.]|jgi:hypothetical protein